MKVLNEQQRKQDREEAPDRERGWTLNDDERISEKGE